VERGKRPVEVLAEAQAAGQQATASPVAFTLPPILLDNLEPLPPTPGYDEPVMVTRSAGAT